MRLYKCDECGRVFEYEEAAWRNRSGDWRRLDARRYDGGPDMLCPGCGCDAIDFGQSCEYCEADLAEEWLGGFQACEKCAARILSTITEKVEETAKMEQVDFATAREWFIGWIERN